MPIADVLRELIKERGPMTVATFMDIALNDPDAGYYARAARRSGRAGDFFTSVDVGPLFGELLEVQIAEMAEAVGQDAAAAFDLVEAGAGNGRLSADILRAARRRHRPLYDRTRLHLVETSPSARADQRDRLGDVADRLRSSGPSLPPSFEGVLIANELLDALPVHQIVMRETGLHEVYVDHADGGFFTREGQPSTPRLRAYLDRLDAALEPGWRADINLRAVDWIDDAARRLRRGFIVLIDYGHQASELYSASHSSGTLTTFARHTMTGPESPRGSPPWLANPGEQDLTSHVDFTSVRAAGEAAGLETLAFLDQTYFLLGILEGAKGSKGSKGSEGSTGSEGSGGSKGSRGSEGSEGSESTDPLNLESLSNRLALKTLLMPGGLGSTHKVLIFGKGVGAPRLIGGSYKMRVT